MSEEKSPRRLNWPTEIYASAVGKKWVMAITGLVLIGFLVTHSTGNLKIYFLDPITHGDSVSYQIDVYGESLRSLLYPIVPKHTVLWVLRFALIASAILHVHAAYSLTLINRRARPIAYQGPREYLVANYASRTMRWSGVIVLLFIGWHLADFTWGVQPMAPAGFEHGAVHNNFVAGFSRLPVSVFYIVANLCLALHLFHGAWSMFQSIGVNNPRFNPWRRRFAQLVTAVIVLPNISFPLAVLAGIIE